MEDLLHGEDPLAAGPTIAVPSARWSVAVLPARRKEQQLEALNDWVGGPGSTSWRAGL